MHLQLWIKEQLKKLRRFLAVSSMTNADCTTPDFAHSGNDILYGGHYNVKDSWEECQASCQAITDCTHW